MTKAKTTTTKTLTATMAAKTSTTVAVTTATATILFLFVWFCFDTKAKKRNIKFSGRTVVSCLGLMNSAAFKHTHTLIVASLFAFGLNNDNDLAWIYEAQTPNVANTREHSAASILQQTQLSSRNSSSSSRSKCRQWLKRKRKEELTMKRADEYNSVLLSKWTQCVCVSSWLRCQTFYSVIQYSMVSSCDAYLHAQRTFFMHFFRIMKCILCVRNFLKLSYFPSNVLRACLVCHLWWSWCAHSHAHTSFQAHAPTFELWNTLNHCINRTTH